LKLGLPLISIVMLPLADEAAARDEAAATGADPDAANAAPNKVPALASAIHVFRIQMNLLF
jgi:hypothetical protein